MHQLLFISATIWPRYVLSLSDIAKSNKFDNILVHVPDKSFFATLDDKDVHKFHHKYGQSQRFWHDIDFILTLNKQKAQKNS